MSEIMQFGRLNDVADIRKLISEPPSMMQRRLQPRIDDHCMAVIGNASVCVVGFADQAGVVFVNLRATPLLRAEAEHVDLVWPADTAIPPGLQRGAVLNCSLYFIVPGIGFALRANGQCSAAEVADGSTRLAFVADALFLHCSRAKVRANFWEPRQGEVSLGGPAGMASLSDQAVAFVSRSPYLLMLTQNAAGKTELSPRGDPDGFVLALDRSTLLIPERPGNKVACTLTNILSHGLVTVAFLIPGPANVLSGHRPLLVEFGQEIARAGGDAGQGAQDRDGSACGRVQLSTLSGIGRGWALVEADAFAPRGHSLTIYCLSTETGNDSNGKTPDRGIAKPFTSQTGIDVDIVDASDPGAHQPNSLARSTAADTGLRG